MAGVQTAPEKVVAPVLLEEAPKSAKRSQYWWRVIWPPAVVIALILAIWQGIFLLLTNGLVEDSLEYKRQQSILPSPLKVITGFTENADVFLDAGRVTFINAFIGFLIGTVVGYSLALLIDQAKWIERSLYLYIVASQMIPVIALAPILYGIIKDETALKITVSAYLTFFPVTVSVLKGLRSVNSLSLELMYTYAANRWQIYTKLRIPAAMPFLFNALKIASTGSLIGAIVAELMGGNAGLGVLILKLQYSSYARSDRLWALIIEVAIIGLLFFLAVSLLERVVVPWQPEYRRK